MIAASGARIVTNFSSNMHLRSGLAPIAAAHKCGCAIAVGVDGLALDEDDDVLREMRLVQMMHGGLGFQRTWTCVRIPRRSPSPTAARRRARRERVRWYLAHQPISSPSISIGLIATRSCRSTPSTFYSRAAMRRCCAMWLWMGGPIVSDGRCTGVDLPAIEQELRGIYRANAKALSGLQRAWPPLVGVAAGLVRSASRLPLGRSASSVRFAKQAHQNESASSLSRIPYCGTKFRLHRNPSKVSCPATRNGPAPLAPVMGP